MDERLEDDDGDTVARTLPAAGGPPIHQRKVQSYSQPLGRDAAITGISKRDAVRKHSLDDSSNPFFSFPDAATDHTNNNTNNGNNAGRSFSYPHYHHSSPPPTYSHHHSASTDEIRLPNPHLPPPLPLHHHPNSTAHFSLDRRKGNSSLSSADGTLTLEHAMSEFGGAPGTLPEFMGSGGGAGIFRVPIRAAMHPGRPTALELRPHPLRETQFGSFLRTIACTRTQLWAGQESGLRYWNLSDAFEGWGRGGVVKRGDEESAPFKESHRTSPTLCLVVDTASGLIWSGHKDGKIRSWRIEEPAPSQNSSPGGGETNADAGSPFKEGLSWHAHRTPVLSMIISAYGNWC